MRVGGRVTERREEQLRKVPYWREVTVGGMVMLVRDVQPQKA